MACLVRAMQDSLHSASFLSFVLVSPYVSIVVVCHFFWDLNVAVGGVRPPRSPVWLCFVSGPCGSLLGVLPR